MDAVTPSVRDRFAPLRLLAELGPVAVVVFIASYAGIAMIDRENGVAPIWIANAFLIYFTLRSPRDKAWQVIAAGTFARFLAGLAIGSTLASATIFSLCNLAEVLIVALPLRALNAHKDFSRPKSLIAFYLLAAGPGPFIPGVFAAAYAHVVRGMDFVPTLVNWYTADGLGLVVIVPILFTVRADAFARMFHRDQILKTLAYVSTV